MKPAPATERHSDFLKSLVEFTKDHRAARWSGTLSEFLESVFRADPKGITRSSHQYMWDMLRSNGFDDVGGKFRNSLFEDDLFGIDDTITRVVDYFKSASDGSEPAHPLLLLLRPPPAAKSTL